MRALQNSTKQIFYCSTKNQPVESLHIFLVSTPVFERRLLRVEGLNQGCLALPFICQMCIFHKKEI